MKRRYLVAAAALAISSALALAQEAPESLLPPSMERPRTPAPAPVPTGPVVQPLPGGGTAADSAPVPADTRITLPSGVKLPPLSELQRMSADQLVEALDIKPKSDIPRLRWWRRRPEVALEEWEREEEPSDKDQGTRAQSGAAELEQRERVAAVRAAVAALPLELREALVLFEYEGMAQAEIAATVGATPKAVEARVARAKEKLRAALRRWM